MLSLDEITHTYYDEFERPLALSVTKALTLSGIDPGFPDIPIVQFHKEQARRIGSSVHEWAEYLDRVMVAGKQPDLDTIEELRGTDTLPYIVAYLKFHQEHEASWEFLELGFGREDCGGTIDRIGVIDTCPVIVDIKTAKEVKPWWQLQLTGYRWLLPPDEELNLAVIHLSSDTTYKLLWYEPDFVTWEAALNVARWKIRP